jgi:predicted SAM-dependent methyltransferase
MELFTVDASTKVQLHLGCGERKLGTFINIDVRPTSATDIVCDFMALPYPEMSVDTIYMCHSLEHIRMPDVMTYLSYIITLLRPRGNLFVSVPDFEILASLYLAGRATMSEIVRAIHGGQEYVENTHYVSYDYRLLESCLVRAGFNAPRRYQPKEFLPSDFSDTSTYEINGWPISLNLRATKGA